MVAHGLPVPGDDGATTVEDELTRRVADLTDLHEFSLRLTQATELATLLDEALDAVMRVQRAELGAVLLYNRERGGLVPVTSRGFAEDYGRVLEEAVGSVQPGGGITGVAFSQRRSNFVADLDDDPASAPYLSLARRAGYRAGGAVPLLDRGGIALGTLTTYFRRPHRPTDREVRLSELYAGLVARTVGDGQRFSALQRAEARYQGLLAAAPDAIVTINAAGMIVLANERAAQLFGYQQEELLGQHVEVLVPEGLRHAHVRHRAAYLAAPLLRPMGSGLDLAGRRRDGATFPVEISLSPLATDDGPLITAIVRDVTARKRAEEWQRFLAEAGASLARSLDEQTTLGSITRLAVPFLADYAIVDLTADDGTLLRTALSHRDPAMEVTLHELARRYPVRPEGDAPIARALRGQSPLLLPAIEPADLAALYEDEEHGRLLRALDPRSVLVVPLVAQGRALGAISLVASASGRRYGPDDQARAEELAARAALAVDNARLYRQAQEALRARDAFFAAASHDLRNPLAIIKMLAQTVFFQARSGTPVPPAVLEREASDIDRAVDRADGLVQQHLDVARLQTGRPLELRRRPTDLVALVRQSATEQQRLSPRHRLDVHTDHERLVGDWDPRRLERVVANLVGNAVKYSPDGGAITVRVSADAENRATLVVQDGGLGIPAQDVPHVFERFHRGSNVVGKIGGTGVGLASSRQIVEQHGGSIGVESAEGRGTTVIIHLPLLDPEDEAETVFND